MYELEIIGENTEEFTLELTTDETEVFTLEIAEPEEEFTLDIAPLVTGEIIDTKPKLVDNIEANGILYHVPEGWEVDDIYAENEGAEIAINLDIVAEGNAVIADYIINGNTMIKLPIGPVSGVGSPAVDLYISSAEWNTTLKFFISLKQIW